MTTPTWAEALQSVLALRGTLDRVTAQLAALHSGTPPPVTPDMPECFEELFRGFKK